MRGQVHPSKGSEINCAIRMKMIASGLLPIDQSFYEVADVALRYGVHEKTVYAGIKTENPLFPVSVSRMLGSRSRIYFLMDEIEACDKRRIQFYQTTPSWLESDDPARLKKFLRRSARSVLGLPEPKKPCRG